MEFEISHRMTEQLAELMRLVAVANRRAKRRFIYSIRFENAAWVTVLRRNWVFDGWTEIIRRDTRITEENLKAAIEAMREEITKEKTA